MSATPVKLLRVCGVHVGEELGLNDDLWNPWSDWLWGEKEWYLLLGYICVLISVRVLPLQANTQDPIEDSDPDLHT